MRMSRTDAANHGNSVARSITATITSFPVGSYRVCSSRMLTVALWRPSAVVMLGS